MIRNSRKLLNCIDFPWTKFSFPLVFLSRQTKPSIHLNPNPNPTLTWLFTFTRSEIEPHFVDIAGIHSSVCDLSVSYIHIGFLFKGYFVHPALAIPHHYEYSQFTSFNGPMHLVNYGFAFNSRFPCELWLLCDKRKK